MHRQMSIEQQRDRSSILARLAKRERRNDLKASHHIRANRSIESPAECFDLGMPSANVPASVFSWRGALGFESPDGFGFVGHIRFHCVLRKVRIADRLLKGWSAMRTLHKLPIRIRIPI